ncbi:MAG: hypothetical protein WCK60_01310 [Candidatus Nomurabacteria bacterium]
MKNNLKKIFLIPFILVLICLFISFLEYKHITHINKYDYVSFSLKENLPSCGTFLEARKNILHECKNFFEFMTNRPAPLDLVLTISVFVMSFLLSLFYFLFNKNKKYFYSAFVILVVVFLVLYLVYINLNDPDALFLTGELK